MLFLVNLDVPCLSSDASASESEYSVGSGSDSSAESALEAAAPKPLERKRQKLGKSARPSESGKAKATNKHRSSKQGLKTPLVIALFFPSGWCHPEPE